MASIAHSNDGRTLMTAVLFADLVGYSKKPVTDQMAAKEALRDFLQAVLASLAPDSRVVIDTGDGAAVAFLADPEHALYFAMCLRRDVKAAAAQGLLRPEDLRLGINLGPVRWAVDVNGRPNLVGEGMNSAERVMSFAAPGETTVSRSFRDAVSCLHASYQQLFEPMGQRADKHGRQHEVFRIAASLLALEAATASLEPAPFVGAWDAPEAGHEGLAATPEAHRQSPARRPIVVIAAAAIVLVAIGVGAWSLRGFGERPTEEMQPVPTAAKATVITVGPASVGKPDSPITSVPGGPVRESGKASADPDSIASAPEPATDRRTKAAKTTRPVPGATPSPRCTFLLQRAALGEGLTAPEQDEFRTSCR
jgi:class 3 adenylate cyclase